MFNQTGEPMDMSALGQWTAEVSFESLLDGVECKPESVVDRISPRAIMWLHTDQEQVNRDRSGHNTG